MSWGSFQQFGVVDISHCGDGWEHANAFVNLNEDADSSGRIDSHVSNELTWLKSLCNSHECHAVFALFCSSQLGLSLRTRVQ